MYHANWNTGTTKIFILLANAVTMRTHHFLKSEDRLY